MRKYVRRVQYTGGSTFIVSLPKDWALKYGLKPGSSVLLEEAGPMIIVRPAEQARQEPKRIVLNVRDETTPETVLRWIIGAYVMGYDEIVVRGQRGIHPQLRNNIRSTILGKLPATEIVNEDVNEIQIQVVLAHDKSPITTGLKRLAKVVLSVLTDACSAIESKNPMLAEEVLKEDDSVDRVYFYVNRLINMAASGRVEIQEEGGLVDLLMYRSVAKLLERIGDHAVNIARRVRELSRAEIPENTYTLCLETIGAFKGSIEAFFSKNPNYVQEVSKFVEVAREKEKEIVEVGMRAMQPSELILLKLLLESMRRIGEYSKDIAELALDLGIERVAGEG